MCEPATVGAGSLFSLLLRLPDASRSPLESFSALSVNGRFAELFRSKFGVVVSWSCGLSIVVRGAERGFSGVA